MCSGGAAYWRRSQSVCVAARPCWSYGRGNNNINSNINIYNNNGSHFRRTPKACQLDNSPTLSFVFYWFYGPWYVA